MKHDRFLLNVTKCTRAEEAARVPAKVGDVLARWLDDAREGGATHGQAISQEKDEPGVVDGILVLCRQTRAD